MKTLPGLLSCLLAISVLLSACLGGRTEVDPDRHPDDGQRRAARQHLDRP
jgi:hypothetical protein